MKRSFLMSALVLALSSAMAMTACGGGGGSDQPAKDGETATKEGGGDSGGDPVAEATSISEGLQKAVDELFQPIKDADALIDSVTKLPADLKAAKSKVDGKKVLAELKKILDGADPQTEALKLEDDAKKIVQERIDKLKALQKSITSMDQAVKDLGTKIADAATKIPAVGAKAVAKIEVALKNPLAGADTKKKAEEDKKKIEDLIKGFKDKVTEWQKLITDIPAKAKAIPEKFAKAFKG
jgi:hypothetical protein